jgi:hypothetical protein
MSEFIAETTIAERQRRAHLGADLCRAAIAEVLTERGLTSAAERPARELSRSEQLLERARRRAATERRTPTEGTR